MNDFNNWYITVRFSNLFLEKFYDNLTYLQVPWDFKETYSAGCIYLA